MRRRARAGSAPRLPHWLPSAHSCPCWRRRCESRATTRSSPSRASNTITCLRPDVSSRRPARFVSSTNRWEAVMRQFTLPDLGEGLEEAEIVAWHVNAGDRVVADQPLLSVETDKAVVEVPSPWSGRVARLFGVTGDLVKVGAALVEFDEGAEQDAGTVVGEIDRGEPAPHTAPLGARASRP